MPFQVGGIHSIKTEIEVIATRMPVIIMTMTTIVTKVLFGPSSPAATINAS